MSKKIAIHILICAQLVLLSKIINAQYVYLMDQDLTNFPVAPKNLNKFKILDSISFTITYEVKIVNDTNKPLDIQNDIRVLQIGDSISKSFSMLLFKADSLYTKRLQEGIERSPMFQGAVPPLEVFKNYPQNRLTVTYRTFGEGPTFKYTEDNVIIDWKILPETKEHLNYLCQKAITTYRGRSYVAWFTSEIPISDGPYKFSGLPGLILEIQDSQKQYVFSCVGIRKEKNKVIKIWDWDYEDITREELNKFLKRIHKNPIAYLKASGISLMQRGHNRKVEPAKEGFSSPYNPIELE